MSSRQLEIGLLSTLLSLSPIAFSASGQPHQDRFPLSNFHDQFCRGKGRVQECVFGNAVMQQILAKGRNAIPVLISQLTDTARTKEPIEDFWSYTAVGDVAYIVLTDLFTDSDWKTFNGFTMPDVPDWNAVMKGCDYNSETCWRIYLRIHGRRSVQKAWLRAWNVNKDQIYWDSKTNCFRVHQHS